MSFSQFNQDTWVLSQRPAPGFYLDIGAAAPVQWNNTVLLERNGWQGVAIDPLMDVADWACNRPTTWAIQSAVVGTTALGETHRPFAVCESVTDLSGFAEHLDRWRDVVMGNVAWRTVPVVAIGNLLDSVKHISTHWHYVSLDIEGAELDILRNWPWDLYTVDLWTIEHNDVEPRRSEIQELMLSRGYYLAASLGVDDCYVKL